MKRQWLSPPLVRAVHDRQIAEHGGTVGLRDAGLLASALARPQQWAAYGDPDPYDLAAAYAVGLIQNHPFLDGNKRTGLVAACLFLELHGVECCAPQIDEVLAMLQVATKELDEPGLAAWFRANTRPLSG